MGAAMIRHLDIVALSGIIGLLLVLVVCLLIGGVIFALWVLV